MSPNIGLRNNSAIQKIGLKSSPDRIQPKGNKVVSVTNMPDAIIETIRKRESTGESFCLNDEFTLTVINNTYNCEAFSDIFHLFFKRATNAQREISIKEPQNTDQKSNVSSPDFGGINNLNVVINNSYPAYNNNNSFPGKRSIPRADIQPEKFSPTTVNPLGFNHLPGDQAIHLGERHVQPSGKTDNSYSLSAQHAISGPDVSDAGEQSESIYLNGETSVSKVNNKSETNVDKKTKKSYKFDVREYKPVYLTNGSGVPKAETISIQENPKPPVSDTNNEPLNIVRKNTNIFNNDPGSQPNRVFLTSSSYLGQFPNS